MAQSFPSFFAEAASAAKGTWALVLGRRDAAQYYDFSTKGLVGSLIAVLLAMILAGFGPMLLGFSTPAGAPTQTVVMNLALFGAQALTASMVLRQIKRQDAFIPYLVASNWITLVSGALLLVSVLFNEAGLIVLLAVAIAAIVTFVNIGRHIMTLRGWQIALLFISQAVGVFLAMGVIALVLPVPTAG
ncbi:MULTISPECIES: hypothetical protein [unclassified Devosia]|uniref:hypothetical protein n=1 Tax=unclassified Devosia TaxID=196773 RepID=UPI00145C61BE|nr:MULTISPECIES: hypothetical protein [unclassified Devosia]MBJ6988782.1 hypothetical protein [Devosia sp. MC521]QMW63083.1 hypothetical protein H4N61_01620 [Devosia sp. MC521]